MGIPHSSPLASRIEDLEDRIVFSGIAAVVTGHTLKITGTSGADSLAVNGVSGHPGEFKITTSGGSMVNGLTNFTASGISSFAISLGDGADALSIGNTDAVTLTGGITISGGADVKTIDASALTLGGGLTVKLGSHTSDINHTTIIGSKISGSVSVATHSGDTYLQLAEGSGGVNFVKGNVTISNGAGYDINRLTDTNIGGNVTISNGHGTTAGLGSVNYIYDLQHTVPLAIAKNVSFTTLDGSVSDGIWDATVHGNVTEHEGTGDATSAFDAYSTSSALQVDGSVDVTGTGSNTLQIGVESKQLGMVVGKGFSYKGGKSDDTFHIARLTVGGGTNIATTGGTSNMDIGESTFVGAVKVTLPGNHQAITIDDASSVTRDTIFESPVLFNLKPDGGNNSINLAGNSAGELLVIENTFTIIDTNTTVLQSLNDVYFPLDNEISVIH